MLHRRSPLVIRTLHWLLWPWQKIFFRTEVTGLENIPAQGPCLLVANHNIGAAFEIHFLADTWEHHFDGKRPAYGLTHRMGFRILGLRQLLGAMGSVPATHEAADTVLREGHTLLVFPGGLQESTRPFWNYKKPSFYGRKGWAQIATRNPVPVIPISIQGSHLTNPVLIQSEWLARLLIIPRLAGLKQFPITLSQILWGGAAYWTGAPWWGVFCAATATALMPLFPTKMRIHFHPPTPIDQVERTIQQALSS